MENQRHKINKKQLCKNSKNGGMAMIDLHEFDMCLKITWIRNLERNNPDWLNFALEFKIDRLAQTDENYHNTLQENIHK